MDDLSQHRKTAALILGIPIVIALLVSLLMALRWHQRQKAREILATSWANFPGVPNRLSGNIEFDHRIFALITLAGDDGGLSVKEVTRNLGAPDQIFPVPGGDFELDYFWISQGGPVTLSVDAHGNSSVYQFGFNAGWQNFVPPTPPAAKQPASRPSTQAAETGATRPYR